MAFCFLSSELKPTTMILSFVDGDVDNLFLLVILVMEHLRRLLRRRQDQSQPSHLLPVTRGQQMLSLSRLLLLVCCSSFFVCVKCFWQTMVQVSSRRSHCIEDINFIFGATSITYVSVSCQRESILQSSTQQKSF